MKRSINMMTHDEKEEIINKKIKQLNNKTPGKELNNFLQEIKCKYDNYDLRDKFDRVIMKYFNYQELEIIIKMTEDRILNFFEYPYYLMIIKYLTISLKNSIVNKESHRHEKICNYMRENYDRDIVEYFGYEYNIEKKYKGIDKIINALIELINICSSYSSINIMLFLNNSLHSTEFNLVASIVDILLEIYTHIDKKTYYTYIKKIYNKHLIIKLEEEFNKKIAEGNDIRYLIMKQLLIGFNNEIFITK